MFNWVKNQFAQEVHDSTLVKAAVDVVFTNKYGDDELRAGNPVYEEMMAEAKKAARPIIEDRWASADDIYQAAKKAIQ